MRKKLSQTFIGIVLVSLLAAIFFQFQIFPANAAGSLTNVSDTMERLKKNTPANQTIEFTVGSNVPNGGYIEIVYSTAWQDFPGMGGGGFLWFLKYAGLVPEAAYAYPGVFSSDADVEVYNETTAHTYTDSLECNIGTEEMDVRIFSEPTRKVILLEFCPGDGGSLAAGDTIKIYAGAFTTETVEDGTNKIVNPLATGIYSLNLRTTNSVLTTIDSGSLSVYIVDSDQVIVTANIDAILTFDLDTNTTAWTGGDDPAPYAVNLGALTTGAVATSADGGSVNYIYVDLATNGIGGAVITVRDVGDGAAGGLYSASRLKNILSGTAVLSPGTEGYGICVRQTQATSGSFVGTGVYNTLAACATHSVGALSLTPTDILNTAGAPADGGRAQILVKAAIGPTTPAATDYTDTLTFIATSTF